MQYAEVTILLKSDHIENTYKWNIVFSHIHTWCVSWYHSYIWCAPEQAQAVTDPPQGEISMNQSEHFTGKITEFNLNSTFPCMWEILAS